MNNANGMNWASVVKNGNNTKLSDMFLGNPPMKKNGQFQADDAIVKRSGVSDWDLNRAKLAAEYATNTMREIDLKYRNQAIQAKWGRR